MRLLLPALASVLLLAVSSGAVRAAGRVAGADASPLQNGGFEAGLANWTTEGSDVAIVLIDPPPACFQPQMPSEGLAMACLSTEGFFGGSAIGGVRSDLTSDAVVFDFRPERIKVSFTVDFQTEESAQSIAHNDAFQARLITPAGTFVLVQIDTFGRTTPGRGLDVQGFAGFLPTDPACQDSSEAAFSGRRTKRLRVSWSKTLDPVLRNQISRGPVYVEFSITDQGDDAGTSIACVDEVSLTAKRPGSN